MKSTNKTKLGITLAGVLALTVTTARADSFGTGLNTFTLDFVNIGNAGNVNDAAFDNTPPGYSSPYGGVGYEYRMGTYEISEDMIAKANTLGGLLITKDTRGVNKAATNVGWNEAARFVNWLNVSSGYAPAYNFAVQPGGGGYTGNENLVLWTVSDAGYNASNLYRNSNAYYFLPSDNEYYKAAFYDPNKAGGAGYWLYATGSDAIPTAVGSGTAAGTAVYKQTFFPGPAAVNSAGGLSPYGTMGQTGNVIEWMESASDGVNNLSSEGRSVRGVYYGDQGNGDALTSRTRSGVEPQEGSVIFGFRVASVASVPEPSCMILMLGSGLMFLARRRRGSSL